MKRSLSLLGSLSLSLFAACSGDFQHHDSSGSTGSVAEALAASQVPVPIATPTATTSAWDGSLVDLMVADTWATCGFIDGRPQPINHKLVAPGDLYLDMLLGHAGQMMASWVAAHPNDSPYALQQWLDYRNDPQYNRNRTTNQAMSTGLKHRSLQLYTLDLTDPNFAAALPQANESVALAAMNACIAQGVRSLSLGGDTLLLSEPEQIQALEVVRERSQIALLQYASIFNALVSPGGTLSGTPTSWQALAALQAWGATSPATKNRAPALKAWATDFAAMVQLHLAVTEELADLFTRSAAAKSPRGGTASASAAEIWGAGSWRQRLLALLYGGDPLAVEADNSSPWSNMVGRTAPGVALDVSVRPADPWPTKAELPYFVTDNKDPHVAQLFALAKQKDAARLLVAADGTTDIENSAQQLYRAVEARLKTERCEALVTPGNTCQVFTADMIPAWINGSTSTPIESYTLFQIFGITKDHARAAVHLLDEYAPPTGTAAIHLVGALSTQTDSKGTWRVIPRDVDQTPRSLAEIAPLFSRYSPYRIPQSVDPNVERSHVETTAANVQYRVGDDQGLAAGGVYAESMRTFGAVPALSAVRDVLRRVGSSTTVPPELKPLLSPVADPSAGALQLGPSVLGTLDASIGAYSTRISPIEATKVYDWASTDTKLAGARVVNERLQTTKVVRSPALKVLAGWNVDVDVASDSAFFQGDSSVVYDVFAVRNDPSAYALALAPTARRFSDTKGIGDLAADATTQQVIATGTIAGGKLHAEVYLPVETLTLAPPPTWTFVARRTAGTTVTYLPISGATPIYTWQFNRIATGRTGDLAPILSYQFAAGGRLGRLATQAWTVQRSNPSQPAYDGFGLPYTWVPAADATAFGSQPGDSVMTYFLRNARDAAAQATDAVRTAIDSSSRADQATFDEQAAQARSQLVMSQETARLCGAAAGTNNCIPASGKFNLSFVWTPMADAWAGVADPNAYCDSQAASDPDRIRQLDCYARQRIKLSMSSVPITYLVFLEVATATPPTFDMYAGGEMQSVLIEQWSAMRRMLDEVAQIEAVKKAAAARIRAGQATVAQMRAMLDVASTQLTGLTADQVTANAAFTRAGNVVALQCAAVLDYMGTIKHSQGGNDFSGWDTTNIQGQGADQTVSDVEYNISGTTGDGSSWSTLRGLEASCLEARNAFEQARQEVERDGVMAKVQAFQIDASKFALEAAQGNTLAEAMDGISSVQREATSLDAALADMAKTIAEIQRYTQEAQLAIQRQNLESALSIQSAQMSLGLNREYSHYDWWRARALLDGARRYAVAARRAIETNYVTELGSLTSPEAFVAAPAAWADDVYRYDLSMPSAVGLSTGQASDGSQYPNQVLDYVGNLERFVQGFAVQRPMSAANDTEIVTVPGPGANIVVNGKVVPDPARTAWSVLCPAGVSCTTAGSPGWCSAQTGVPLSQTCAITPASPTGTVQYAAPTKARATLYLDAWGQSIGRAPIVAYDSRVNARWGRFALNLVGNGIRDCSTAASPNDCQANQYLKYDLHHEGPSLAIGATRQWRLLDIPLAQVESGKAPTLGEFLDVEQNAWGKPFVEAVARAELIGRPMNGTYVIELTGDSTVTFDRIEALQLLYGSTYWVMQQ